MRFETRLLAAGSPPETRPTGDLVPPIHVSTAFDQFEADVEGYYYGRSENPTREALERVLASLENAEGAVTFASGQAAAAAICALLPPDSRIIASADHYSGTHALFQTLADRGVETVWADLTDLSGLDQVLADAAVSMIWVETPTNPLLQVADIATLSLRARRHEALLVVDNTVAGPALQQPLDHGADVSLYSTTKIISGHLDAMGGAVIYRDEAVGERLRAHRNTVGGVPSPFDCYQIHRGLKTLAVRVERQTGSAAELAQILLRAPGVAAVHYPGLANPEENDLVARQMRHPGYLVSFTIDGDPQRLLRALRIIRPAVSLGGVQSLLQIPATMTHAQMPEAYKAEIGLASKLMRLSVGLEHPADLQEDLLAALAQAME